MYYIININSFIDICYLFSKFHSFFRALQPLFAARQKYLETQSAWEEEIDQLSSEYKGLSSEYEQTGLEPPPETFGLGHYAIMKHRITEVRCEIRDNNSTKEDGWIYKVDSYLESMNLKYNALKEFMILEIQN